jgi:hypothetical protein
MVYNMSSAIENPIIKGKQVDSNDVNPTVKSPENEHIIIDVNMRGTNNYYCFLIGRNLNTVTYCSRPNDICIIMLVIFLIFIIIIVAVALSQK